MSKDFNITKSNSARLQLRRHLSHEAFPDHPRLTCSLYPLPRHTHGTTTIETRAHLVCFWCQQVASVTVVTTQTGMNEGESAPGARGVRENSPESSPSSRVPLSPSLLDCHKSVCTKSLSWLSSTPLSLLLLCHGSKQRGFP